MMKKTQSTRHGYSESLLSNRRPWFLSRRLKRTANDEEDSAGDSFGRPVKIRIRISRRRGKVPVRDYLHLLNSEDDGQDDGDMLEHPLRVGKNMKALKPAKKPKKNRQNDERFIPEKWIQESGRKKAPSSGSRRVQVKSQRRQPVRRNQKKEKPKKKKKNADSRAESDIGRELSALAEWFLRDDAAFDKILQETMSSYRRGRQLRPRRHGFQRKHISLTLRN